MSTTSDKGPDLSYLSSVLPEELYDGPRVNGSGFSGDIDPALADTIKPGIPEPVAKPLFTDAQPAAEPEPELVDNANALRVLFEILSTRVLGLVATVAACAIWAVAVWQPDLSRTAAAVGFSITVLIPIVGLYWRTATMAAGRDQ